MIDNFHFIRPQWFFALVPILVLAWFWFRRTRSGSAWQSAISKSYYPCYWISKKPDQANGYAA